MGEMPPPEQNVSKEPTPSQARETDLIDNFRRDLEDQLKRAHQWREAVNSTAKETAETTGESKQEEQEKEVDLGSFCDEILKNQEEQLGRARQTKDARAAATKPENTTESEEKKETDTLFAEADRWNEYSGRAIYHVLNQPKLGLFRDSKNPDSGRIWNKFWSLLSGHPDQAKMHKTAMNTYYTTKGRGKLYGRYVFVSRLGLGLEAKLNTGEEACFTIAEPRKENFVRKIKEFVEQGGRYATSKSEEGILDKIQTSKQIPAEYTRGHRLNKHGIARGRWGIKEMREFRELTEPEKADLEARYIKQQLEDEKQNDERFLKSILGGFGQEALSNNDLVAAAKALAESGDINNPEIKKTFITKVQEAINRGDLVAAVEASAELGYLNLPHFKTLLVDKIKEMNASADPDKKKEALLAADKIKSLLKPPAAGEAAGV